MLERLSIKGLLMKELMKRFLILAGVVTAMLLVVAPAFAQESPQYKSEAGSGEEVSATGVLKAGLPADVVGDGTHSIVDETTGTLYALRGTGANLDAYVDQPVTVYGTLTPGEDIPGAQGIATSTLASIDVTSVEALDAGPGEDGEEIRVAGLLEARGLAADRSDITHYITDEGTGQMWGLISDDPQGVLDPYNGQRVTVTGTDATDFTPGGAEIPAIIVTKVDPSGTRDGNPPDDVNKDPGQPSTETFQGYAAEVGSAGMRIDSDQSGEPCAGGASLTAAFTSKTGFFARRDGVDVPIAVNKVGNGDLVLVSYDLAPDKAIAAVCPSSPINIDFLTILEDGAPDSDSTVGKPGPKPGGSTSDQYTDAVNSGVDSPSVGSSSSVGTSFPTGLSGLLPDTGGLPLLTLGLGSLLLLGGGVLGYRYIRQR